MLPRRRPVSCTGRGGSWERVASWRGDGMGCSPARKSIGRVARACALALGSLVLAHCSSPFKEAQYSPRVVESGEIPKGGGHYKLGKPYTINGKTYLPTRTRTIAPRASPPGTGRTSTAG